MAQHCVELHGGNGVMLDFGVEKVLRDAAIFLHMDATVRHLEVQDRQVDVSGYGGQVRRTGDGPHASDEASVRRIAPIPFPPEKPNGSPANLL